MTRIQLENVSVAIDGQPLLKRVSVAFEDNCLIAIVGPNGAGKTTMMRSALGLVPNVDGRISIDGRSIFDMTPTERARHIAYIPQHAQSAWPIAVRDVIALGRYAYGAPSARWRSENEDLIKQSAAACRVDDLLDRRIDGLSGGELARVHCARAFVAQTPFLFADEPTASLDPAGQIDILNWIRQYASAGKTALIITHDVNLAAAFSDRIIWMKDGEIISDGSPSQTMTPEILRRTFDIDAAVTSANGSPRADYLGR